MVIKHTENKATTKKERAEMYRAFLEEEGYRPRIDDDGDVIFKCEGRNYIIILDDEDDEFFRIVYPNFWGIESEPELAEVKEAALNATIRVKVAKVFPVGDSTWAEIELFCFPPEAFKPVFRRCLAALQTAVQTFISTMGEASSLRIISSQED